MINLIKMNLVGKIIHIGETQTFGASNFEVRKFVVETYEKYPQKIELSLLGQNVDIIDPYQVGDEVSCNFNLNGKEAVGRDGETRYYNTVACWQIQYNNSVNEGV